MPNWIDFDIILINSFQEYIIKSCISLKLNSLAIKHLWSGVTKISEKLRVKHANIEVWKRKFGTLFEIY